MIERLKGKVALITGAGSGIGRTSALLFAREGANVVVGDFNSDSNAETVGMIEAQGGTAFPVQLDVTVAQQVAAAVQATLYRFGPLAILFHNSGTGGRQCSI